MGGAARDRFLRAFEPSVRPHIIEFGKHLTGLDVDVAVLMARKAACLVDSMADADLTRLPAAVTSERSLDMDLEWVRGKRIALIDDVLITGTTLYAARERLLAAGAAAVSTHVLSVDSAWNAHLVEPDPPFLITDNQGSVRLCTQIVEAISVTPRPYNVDWPLFDDVSIPAHALHFLTSMTSWQTTNTSTGKQYTSGILSVTHDATSPVGTALDESLGWPVSKAAPLVKVRVLARPKVPKDRRLHLRVMPVVAFEALPIHAVDEMFKSITALATDERAALFDEFTSATSRLRLVQYVAAARLFSVWLSEMRELADIEAVDTLQSAQMRYAFPPHMAPLIQRACSSGEALLSMATTSTRDPAVQGELASPGPFDGNEPEWVQARLTHPFHLFFTDREIPARHALKEGGLAVLTDPQYANLVGRLRTGHNLTDLERVAAAGSGLQPGEARQLVSRFLDLAIDHGVVVPIIEERDGKLQRAYRHGEDIFFSRSEQRLFHLMLQQLMETSQLRSLNRIVVEKAFVLLLRAGVAKQFLNLWTGRLGAPESIGIRYDLYGAVVERDAPELFGHMHNQSLARFMVSLGTLEETPDRKYVPARELPDAPTSRVAEEEARKLGILLGGLLNPSRRDARLSDDDLAFLVTCPSDRDVALALAAEVDLIQRQWPGLHDHGFAGGRVTHGSRRESALQNSVVYKAAESGASKYGKHVTSSAEIIIERLSNELHGLERSEWMLLWARLRDPDLHRSDSQLNRLNNRLGAWLLVIRLQFLLLRIGYLTQEQEQSGDGTVKRRLAMLFGDAHRTIRQLPAGDEEWNNRLTELQHYHENGAFRPERVIADAVGTINRLVSEEADGLIDHTKAIATPFGQPRPVITYTSALAVHLHAKDGRGQPADRHLRKVTSLINTRRKHAGDRDGRLSSVTISHPGDFLLCATGTNARDGLASLAADVLSAVASQCNVELIAIPELTENLQPHEAEGFGTCHAAVLISRIKADRLANPVQPGTNRVAVMAPGSIESVQRYLDVVQLHASGVRFDVTAPAAETRTGWVGATMTATPNGSIESRSKFDIAVITIVSEQTAAIRAALEGAQDFNEWVGPARRWFTSGTLPPLDDSAAGIRVIATQTMDQGNRSVISAYNELRRQGRTKLAVLVDIAGGIHRDVRLGDVVVADRVIYYDQRALTAEGTQRRGDTFRLPTEIASTVNRFFALNGEPTVLPATAAAAELMSRAEAACDQPSPPVFRIRKGPIASGEAVIKHRDDETRMWIHGFNDKTLAVETEAAGLAVAAHEEGRDNPSYGALVIRGISDHADQDKNDEWRTVAAAHAVLALRAMAPVIGQTLLSTRQANRPSS